MSKYYGVTFADSRNDSLEHFGIKGQKWGVRRFQNEDGSLTEAGQKRYGKYKTRADNFAKSAQEMSYWRKQTEGAGKKFGEAWTSYATMESKDAHAAIKYQNKANKYVVGDQRVDMKKNLRDAGVEIDKYSKKSLNKAASDAFKTVMKVRTKDMSDKEFDELFRRSVEESLKRQEWEREDKRFEKEHGGRDQFTVEAQEEFDSAFNLPHGKERNAKLEKFLKDNAGDDDSFGNDILVEEMRKRSGSYHNGNSVTEQHRVDSKALHDAGENVTRIEDALDRKLRNLDPKEQARVKQSNAELKQARTVEEKAYDKLAKTILKDMDMPINANTIKYIKYVILSDFWY